MRTPRRRTLANVRWLALDADEHRVDPLPGSCVFTVIVFLVAALVTTLAIMLTG